MCQSLPCHRFIYIFFLSPLLPYNFTEVVQAFHGSPSVSSVQSLSRVRLFATPWIAARQASPCPSPTPGVHSDSRPSSQWCHPAISSSVVPFSCPQSLPASEPFPMSQLFTWGGQSTGVSALASFPPKKSQGWSPSEWTGWISSQSKGLSRVFSNTTVQKHQFFSAKRQPEALSPFHPVPMAPTEEVKLLAQGRLSETWRMQSVCLPWQQVNHWAPRSPHSHGGPGLKPQPGSPARCTGFLTTNTPFCCSSVFGGVFHLYGVWGSGSFLKSNLQERESLFPFLNSRLRLSTEQ